VGRTIGSHQFAQRHQACGDDAIERGLYLRIAEIERGLRGVDLRLLEPGARGIAIGRRLVERRLRRNLAARQLGLAFVLRLGLLQCRLSAGLRGPRLFELKSVRLRLDDEENGPLLRLLAVLVVDLLQKTLHPRDHVRGADGRGVTRRLEVAGDLLLHRNGDGDLRRRRRHVAVLLSAARERRREDACRSARGELRARQPINPHCATLK
jgi:hypothetical protein